MVCFNAAKYIEKAILSVLGQGYPDLELVIVDGASKDGTVDIIKKYQGFIKWVSEPDSGQTNALNKGFAMATGEVLCWINADEEYLEGALLEVGKAFRDDQELDVAFGDRKRTDADGNLIRHERLPAMHPKHFMVYTYGLLFSDTTFWRRRVHELTGRLDEEHYPHLAMDFDWFIRLSVHVKKWRKLDRYISIFKDRQDRKTAVAGRKASSGKWIRDKMIKDLKINKLQLLTGWVFFGVMNRLQTRGMAGLLWMPNLRVIHRILGSKE